VTLSLGNITPLFTVALILMQRYLAWQLSRCGYSLLQFIC